MALSTFLLQIQPPAVDPASILNDGKAAADATAAAMDGLWKDVLGGGLYKAISDTAAFFAVVTLLAWLVNWYKAMLEGDEYRAFGELIWVLLVIFLLSGQAAPLRTVTLGMRNVINITNNNLLNTTANNISLQQNFQSIMARGAAQDNAQAIISQCSSITDPQGQDACMKDAISKAKQMGDASTSGGSWWDNFLNSLNPITGIQNDLMLMMRGWLMALGAGFQYCIEVALLLTALLGPIAVGLSLLPVGGKAIFAWAMGFYSVGFTKLAYNIICGLVATIILNSGNNDPLLFAFITAILAPILAMAIAAGGGMSIFNSLVSIGTMATKGAGAVVSGGASVIVDMATKE